MITTFICIFSLYTYLVPQPYIVYICILNTILHTYICLHKFHENLHKFHIYVYSNAMLVAIEGYNSLYFITADIQYTKCLHLDIDVIFLSAWYLIWTNRTINILPFILKATRTVTFMHFQARAYHI